jgi:hypothetical protein
MASSVSKRAPADSDDEQPRVAKAPVRKKTKVGNKEAAKEHVKASSKIGETFTKLADASVGTVPVIAKPFNTVREIPKVRDTVSQIAAEIEAPRTTAIKQYDMVQSVREMGTYHFFEESGQPKETIRIPPIKTDTVSIEQAQEATKKMVESIVGSSEDPAGFKIKIANPFRFVEQYLCPVSGFEDIWKTSQALFDTKNTLSNSVPAIRRAVQQNAMCEAGDSDNSRCMRENMCLFSFLNRVCRHPLDPLGEKVGLSFEIAPHDEKDMVIHYSQSPPMPRRYPCIICRRFLEHFNILKAVAENSKLETFPNSYMCYVDEPGEYRSADCITTPNDCPITWGPCVPFSVAHFLPIIRPDGKAGYIDSLPIF